jgi:hypothetical protein
MILGMSTSAFTFFHVVVSLIAIVTGIIVAVTMLVSKTTNGWTAIFLATTALTSITGFPFPRDHVLPSHIVGAVSLLVLIIAIVALRLSASALVALDLCRECARRSISECLCSGRTSLPEGGHPESAGADAIGSGIRRCSADRPGPIRGTWNQGSETLSS